MTTRNRRTQNAISKKVPKKKSSASKGGSGRLIVRTPQNSALQFLADAGIVAPEEIPSDEDSIPLDFTHLGNRDIGAVHSRFSVRHSHAIFHSALRASNLVVRKRNLRIAEAKFRVLHSGEKKTDVDAAMEDDKRISKRRTEIAKIEAELEILNAVAAGYEDIRNAASREMTRRIGERAATD